MMVGVVKKSEQSLAAYAAALWALVFAVLHLVWAAGWYVGLEPEQAREAFDADSSLAWRFCAKCRHAPRLAAAAAVNSGFAALI